MLPLDPSDVARAQVELKLTTAFMFWELDYAGIDYTENEIISIEKQVPVNAIDETGQNVSDMLAAADGNHLVQPEPGNITTISYDYHKPLEGQAQTYILHSKGWYETIRDFRGQPDVTFLQQFKKEGALASFSLELFSKEQAAQAITAKK